MINNLINLVEQVAILEETKSDLISYDRSYQAQLWVKYGKSIEND